MEANKLIGRILTIPGPPHNNIESCGIISEVRFDDHKVGKPLVISVTSGAFTFHYTEVCGYRMCLRFLRGQNFSTSVVGVKIDRTSAEETLTEYVEQRNSEVTV